MPIRVLDAATIGRIAAGEVVERPASVVKELIENSIDAGATSITIEIRDGGIAYMRVTDNGVGLSPSDARLAFENHATSKIKSGDDLTDILTFGFRGEALPSIAAVSKVELDSQPHDAQSGVSVRVEGGRLLKATEVGCPVGTSIVVRDLFFNTPARKSFLKRTNYEAGLVIDVVSRMALGNAGVAMRLVNNGKTLFHGFGDGRQLHAALTVYGHEVASNLSEIDESEGGIRVRGLLGVGNIARANRSYQSLFVNGRLVRCPMIIRTLEEACKGRVMVGMYPVCALHITLPPNAVDVNVHPNKLEIRFRDEEGVRLSLNALFERALKAGDGMLDMNKLNEDEAEVFEKAEVSVNSADRKQTGVDYKQTEVPFNQTEVDNQNRSTETGGDRIQKIQTEAFFQQTEVSNNQTKVSSPENDSAHHKPSHRIEHPFPEHETSTHREGAAFPPVAHASPPSRAPKPASSVSREKKAPPEIRIIGTAFDTYVFVEIEKAVLIIDQHAAHERLLYEKYIALLEKGNAAQQLLTPQVIGVSRREQELLISNQTLLYEIGYEVEPFGERDIQVRSVPFVLGMADQRALFISMLDELDQLKSAAFERRRQDIIKFSCRRAVKAGDKLTDDEIKALLADMIKSGAPPTCPHGRPVIRKLTKTEIERFFKR